MVVVLGFFVGCDKDDPVQVANNVTEQPNMNGTFRSACAGSDLAGLSVRETLKFEGNKFTREQSYFETADCTEEQNGGTVTVEGDFTIDADGLPQSEAGAVQLDLKTAYITPHAAFLVTALNAINYCGYSDYAIDVKRDVSGGTDSATCVVLKVPQTVYGAYRLDDKKLYLNEGGVGEMSESATDRPAKLDTSKVYTRE